MQSPDMFPCDFYPEMMASAYVDEARTYALAQAASLDEFIELLVSFLRRL